MKSTKQFTYFYHLLRVILFRSLNKRFILGFLSRGTCISILLDGAVHYKGLCIFIFCSPNRESFVIVKEQKKTYRGRIKREAMFWFLRVQHITSMKLYFSKALPKKKRCMDSSRKVEKDSKKQWYVELCHVSM